MGEKFPQWAARGRGEKVLAHGEEIAVAAGWVALPRMLLVEVNEDVYSSAVHSSENWKLPRHQQRKSLNRGLLNLQVVCCLFSNAGSFLPRKVIFFCIYLFICLLVVRKAQSGNLWQSVPSSYCCGLWGLNLVHRAWQ